MSHRFLGHLWEGWQLERDTSAFLLSIQVVEIFQDSYFIFEKHFEVFKTILYPLPHLIQITLSNVSQENSPHFSDEKAKTTEVPPSLFKAVFPN